MLAAGRRRLRELPGCPVACAMARFGKAGGAEARKGGAGRISGQGPGAGLVKAQRTGLSSVQMSAAGRAALTAAAGGASLCGFNPSPSRVNSRYSDRLHS
jgi:hypothetical protein